MSARRDAEVTAKIVWERRVVVINAVRRVTSNAIVQEEDLTQAHQDPDPVHTQAAEADITETVVEETIEIRDTVAEAEVEPQEVQAIPDLLAETTDVEVAAEAEMKPVEVSLQILEKEVPPVPAIDQEIGLQ